MLNRRDSPPPDRRDVRLLLFVCLIVLAGKGLLLLTVASAFPEDRIFTGCLFNNVDYWGYRAYANYYRHGGGLAIDNPWATERHAPAFINLTWLLVGRLMAIGVPFRVAWHALQTAGSCLLLACLLILIRRLTSTRAVGWCAFLLCAFGSGFGWLAALADPGFSRPALRSVDLYQTDAFPVMSFWHMPHVSLSWALLAAIYLLMHKSFSGEGRRWAVMAGAVALLMGFMHPYHLVTILPVTAAWWLVLLYRRAHGSLGRLIDLSILALGALPGIAYYGLVIPLAPNFAHVWQAARFEDSIRILPVLLGYGLFLPLALAGLAGLSGRRRRLEEGEALILTWLAVQGVIHFGHIFSFSPHLGEGLLIPLSILAGGGFLGIRRRLLERMRHASVNEATNGEDSRVPWAWIIPLVAAVLPTAIYLMGHQARRLGGKQVSGTFTSDVSVSMSPKFAEAAAFLDRDAGNGYPLVLSSLPSGLRLPGLARVRALIGNAGCVDKVDEKEMVVKILFCGKAEVSDWLWVLSSYPVEFVWWGPDEDCGSALRMPDQPFMKRVFDNGEVTIYRVDRRAL